jgi:alpha-ribazole phosphatase
LSRLLLVRHGDTKLNNATRFWGKTDVELSDDGIRQAEQLRDRLATQRLDTIYASEMSRARVTAEIIASKHSISIDTYAELNEIDFGQVEGLTYDEIIQLHPELAEVLNKWNPRPRFPGGENLDDLDRRVQKFLKSLKNHQPEETILIVAHAGTLRLMICDLLGLGLEHWRHIQVDLASISIVETYPQGAILNLLNDVSHLK